MPEANVSAFKAGVTCRCPRCGEGNLFDGYLTVAAACSRCGLDYSRHDSGDGPAVFVTFFVGIVVVALALIVEVVAAPPVWLHLVIWVPAILAASLYLLRPFKGVLIALQYKHNAGEGTQP
ncbi:MAG: DUF983 domain-containing protein [Proteobacteria bacterium]|nr:DUF983 domain-containing protein [Pseudomonadota bacterium]